MHIDEADLVPPLVVNEELLPLSGGHANPRIKDVDFIVLRVLDEAHFDFSAFRPLEDAMNHGVFHEGLQQQRRYLNGIQFILWEIIGDFQAVTKASPLQLRIAFNDVKLLGQGNELGWVIQAVAEVVRQVLDEFSRRIGITSDVVADGIQRVVEEMGVDLGLEGADFRFRQQVFLFLHLVVFINGFHHVADAVEKFDTHLCESIALALGGNDVAHGIVVVHHGQCHEVGHVGQFLLQLRYGDFCVPLVPVGIIPVIGMDIQMIFVGNGGPGQVWQGGCYKFRNAGDVRVVKSIVESGKEGCHRIECGTGGLGLFRIPLVDEEFNDHVEQAHGDGIGYDNRQGQAEEAIGIV